MLCNSRPNCSKLWAKTRQIYLKCQYQSQYTLGELY